MLGSILIVVSFLISLKNGERKEGSRVVREDLPLVPVPIGIVVTEPPTSEDTIGGMLCEGAM